MASKVVRIILCKLSCHQEYVDRRHYVQVLCNIYDFLSLVLDIYISDFIYFIIYLRSEETFQKYDYSRLT